MLVASSMGVHHQVYAEVMAFEWTYNPKVPAHVHSFCEHAKAMLIAARPRELKCGVEKQLVLIFIDRYWEKGVAGIWCSHL